MSEGCLTVYVCLKTVYLSWKMKHTRSSIHPRMALKNISNMSCKERLSMYVCLKTFCLSWKMKHTRSSMHAPFLYKNIKNFAQEALYYFVCLKTLCLSWKMKHTRSNNFNNIDGIFRVCLKKGPKTRCRSSSASIGRIPCVRATKGRRARRDW